MTKAAKLKTGRELRAEADALLTTVAKHVKATAKKKPAVSANRAERLRAAETSVRTAKSARPASRSALAGDTVSADKQKAIAVAVAVRRRFNEHRR